MSALAAPRIVPEKLGVTSNPPVAAGAKIHHGALVVMDAGFAKPAATAVGLVTLGIAEESVDNTGGAAGAKRVLVKRGCFLFANLAGDAITEADIGKDAYVVDDQTVAKTSATNTRSIAGTVIDLDAIGVWIRVGL